MRDIFAKLNSSREKARQTMAEQSSHQSEHNAGADKLNYTHHNRNVLVLTLVFVTKAWPKFHLMLKN